MALSAREAFKVGFMARCVEHGMNTEQMLGAVKTAMDKLALLGVIGDAGKELLRLGGSVGVPLALAAPPILGGIAGAGLAKVTDVSDKDVSDIKDREVIDTYRTEAAKVRRQQAIRALQQAKQNRGGRMFL
jgi:hypothetical protein